MSHPAPGGAFEALRTLAATLDASGFRYMIVGGLATFAWGEPRTTRDFDVAVLVDAQGLPV